MFALCNLALIALCLATPRLPQDPPGHLVLVVRGNARGLEVVHVAKKPSPWAGLRKGLRSDFALRILDGDGRELQRVPLDLQHFETRDDRIGQKDHAECCKVITSNVAMLVNVPDLPKAKSWQFVRRDTVIGTVSAARVDALRSPR